MHTELWFCPVVNRICLTSVNLLSVATALSVSDKMSMVAYKLHVSGYFCSLECCRSTDVVVLLLMCVKSNGFCVIGVCYELVSWKHTDSRAACLYTEPANETCHKFIGLHKTWGSPGVLKSEAIQVLLFVVGDSNSCCA